MSLPRCPRCMTPIEYDWDYCHTCGLSSEEIVAGLEAGDSVGVVDGPQAEASAPGAPPPPPPPPSEPSSPFGPGGPAAGGAFGMPGVDDGPPPPPMPPGPPPPGPPPSSDHDLPRFGSAGPEAPAPPGAAGGFALGGAGGMGGTGGVHGSASVGPPSSGPVGPGYYDGPVDPANPMAPAPGASLMEDHETPKLHTGPILAGRVSPTAFIAIGAVFVALLAFMFLTRTDRSTQNTSTGPTPPPLGAIQLGTIDPNDKGAYQPPSSARFETSAMGWIIFRPDDGTFTIEMPKAPTDARNINVKVDGNDIQTLVFTKTDMNGGYAIAVADVGEVDPVAYLPSFAKGYARALDGGIAGSKATEHQGRPAYDFYIDAGDYSYNARATVVGGRIYVVTAGGLDVAAFQWEAFRDSFKPAG